MKGVGASTDCSGSSASDGRLGQHPSPEQRSSQTESEVTTQNGECGTDQPHHDGSQAIASVPAYQVQVLLVPEKFGRRRRRRPNRSEEARLPRRDRIYQCLLDSESVCCRRQRSHGTSRMPMPRELRVTLVSLDHESGTNRTQCRHPRSTTTRRPSRVRRLRHIRATKSRCGCQAQPNPKTHRLPNHRLEVGP
jgi:hypothetical protein